MIQGRAALAAPLVASILLSMPTPALASHSVILSWNPSVDHSVVGYNVYYGTASGVYSQIIPVGNVTSVTVSNLVTGVTYFFVVTAVDSVGLESLPSNELSYTVPSPASPTVLALAKIPGLGLLNALSLTSTGVDSTRWAIEASADLKTWRTLTLGTNASVHLAVIVSSAPQMLFRLRSGTPGVRLALQPPQTNGFLNSFSLTSVGASPQQWALDASSDLKTWTAFDTGSNSPVSAAIIVSKTSCLFFRLKAL